MFTVATGQDEPRNTRGGTVPTPRSRRGVKGFFAEVGREMRKVSWPSRHETLRLSGVVLALCIMVTVYLSVLGYVFDMFVNLMTKGRV